MMKTSSVMMILMVDTADSSSSKHRAPCQGRHSIGAPSAMSTFEVFVKTASLSIFLNKYAKNWTWVPSPLRRRRANVGRFRFIKKGSGAIVHLTDSPAGKVKRT